MLRFRQKEEKEEVIQFWFLFFYFISYLF